MPNWKDKGDVLFISAGYQSFVVHAINKCDRTKRDKITRYVSPEFFEEISNDFHSGKFFDLKLQEFFDNCICFPCQDHVL